jgi:hypothetical protein
MKKYSPRGSLRRLQGGHFFPTPVLPGINPRRDPHLRLNYSQKVLPLLLINAKTLSIIHIVRYKKSLCVQ